MFTGIIIGTGRIVSVEDHEGDLKMGIDVGGRDTGARDVGGRDTGTRDTGARNNGGTDTAALDIGSWAIGDSIAVQGVCLTVTAKTGTVFFADVSLETLSKTTLGGLAVGSRVNLEPALRAGDALGGHMVSGHVDAVGRLTEARRDGRSWRLEFELPAALMRFVAPKGSICLDGVSLTVNQVGERRFDVNIIPHTHEVTTLGELVLNAGVNVEIDLVARYLDRLLPKPTEANKT